MSRLTTAAAGLALLLSLSGSYAAAADAYPDHPIKLVVGYTPGGGADIMARLIQQQLSEAFKQSVIVENRPGAGQNIASSYVAHAKPDGYTLLVSSSALAVNISLYRKLDYDPVKDFAPIAVFAESPNLLVVRKALPVNSVKELIAYAKSRPGALNFSSSGSGSTQHLSGELFKLKTGINAMHIPYKGTMPSITAVLSGEVDFSFMNIPSAKTYILNHQLKGLAITAAKRSPVVPEIPTMEEAGVKGMDVAAWYGVLGPAGMPKAVVQKLNAAIDKAVASGAFRKKLEDLGTTPLDESPAYFKHFLSEDIARWRDVIHAAHIHQQ